MKWNTLKFESIQIAQVLKLSTGDMCTKASDMEIIEYSPFSSVNNFFSKSMTHKMKAKCISKHY